MSFLVFLSNIVLSYIGLFVGVFLGTFSPEEMVPGEKYFWFLKKFIIMIGFFVLFNSLAGFLITNYVVLVILSGIISFLSFKIRFNNQALYVAFPLISFIFRSDMGLLVLFSIMFFLFGFPTGSEYCISFVSKKDSKKLIGKNKEKYLLALKGTNLYLVSSFIILILYFLT